MSTTPFDFSPQPAKATVAFVRYLLVLCVLLVLTACGDGDQPEQDSDTPAYPPLQALGQLRVTNGQFRDFAALNNYLYIAAGFDGLQVIDVRDLMAPRQVGAIPHSSPGGAYDQVVAVAVVSSTLIVSVYPGCSGFCQPSSGELRFYDLTTPTEPRFIGVLPTAAYSFSVDQTTVFALGPTSGFPSLSSSLRVIDIASPSLSRVVATISVANATRLATQRTRLFLSFSDRSGGSPGLQVVDVSDPRAPAVVGIAGNPSSEAGTNDVAADSTAVFTASGTAQLLSYPTSGAFNNPTSTSLQREGSGLALSGRLLLVAQADLGVAVFWRDAGTGITRQNNFSVDGPCIGIRALGAKR